MGPVLSFHQPHIWEDYYRNQHRCQRLAKTKSSVAVVKALSFWDERFVDDPSNPTESGLSLRGIAVLASLSACSCYALRLVFRDNAGRMARFRMLAPAKQLTVELYALGTLHAAAWAWFTTQKILRGCLCEPHGTTRALSLSAGYYLHNLVVLRSLILYDPLMLLHHVMDLVTHASMLRSPGTQWLVPLVMSKHLPNALLNALRLFRVLEVHPGRAMLRTVLWSYAAAFLLTKGVGVPAVCAWHWAVRPKPEFHQPRYLPAKLALAANISIYHVWFQQVLRGAPEILRFAGQGLSLQQLREVALQPLGRAVGALQLVGGLMTYVVGPLALPVLGLLLRGGRRRLGALLASTLALLALSPLPHRGQRWFTNSWAFRFTARRIMEYFGFRAVQEGAFDRDRRHLCAMFPHGFQATGTLLFVPHLTERGLQPNVCGASVLFALPVLRQLLAAVGGSPAARPRLMECLRRPAPHNVTLLVPGGIAEMFLTRPDVEHVLSDRKGFVRCALEAGADLVPCYCLGNTQVFQVAGGVIGKVCERVSRWSRMSLLPFHGLWGTVMPYPHPVVVLVGRPIRVEAPVAAPSKAQVDELHERFFIELTALFHKNKHLVPGYEDKELYLGSTAVLPPPPLPDLAEYSRSRL
mmetsp:Transcript_1800/g.5402  ORF Transcript_1800/g.5402 Transcript_1800/m.5402 type:complete len:638 (-) Transcript_1800:35-1948(-)